MLATECSKSPANALRNTGLSHKRPKPLAGQTICCDLLGLRNGLNRFSRPPPSTARPFLRFQSTRIPPPLQRLPLPPLHSWVGQLPDLPTVASISVSADVVNSVQRPGVRGRRAVKLDSHGDETQ
jgi:hypothetical protein